MRRYGDERDNEDRWHDLRKVGEIDEFGHWVDREPPRPRAQEDRTTPDQDWAEWRGYLESTAAELGVEPESFGLRMDPPEVTRGR